MSDLKAFVGVLPYASELFGIYQPLLGWKSQRVAKRVEQSRQQAYTAIARTALTRVQSTLRVHAEGGGERFLAQPTQLRFKVSDLRPVDLDAQPRAGVAPSIDSGVARMLAEQIGSAPPEDWRRLVTTEHMTELLEALQESLQSPEELARRPAVAAYVSGFVAELQGQERETVIRTLFDKESRVAGYLVFLAQHAPSQLTPLFFPTLRNTALQLAHYADPLENFGSNATKAILSPVGIIHLYREYFFEFDSFLGPPVGHVWLSPGGTIELVEVNTRKVFTERTIEQSFEFSQRSERETRTQDDIADAVREENQNSVKFGFTNTASYTTPVFQDTATASFSIDSSKSNSRESTYKHMRQQSEKLTSEIKRNFKTTFRTSTETTDTTSKRYVIQNSGPRLVNYELRRKMRKVGVQVQDIGVQMCWHTFVDDPARELGIAKLVHLGEPPNMEGVVAPDAPITGGIETQEVSIPIPFEGLDTDDNDQAYTNGSETEVAAVFDETEHIRAYFPQSVTYTKPGYTLAAVSVEAVGMDARVSPRNVASEPDSSRGSFDVHLDYVNWGGRDQFSVKAILTWTPSEAMAAKAQAAYEQSVAKFTAESARRYKEAFVKASRERIKVASNIRSRPADELREEERTVVYRRLISQLMSVAPSESKHVVSELVRSIFDVDKMLYFVAPEWWVPRLHRSTQQLGEEVKPPSATPAPSAPAPAASPKPVTHLSASVVNVKSVLKYTEVVAALAAAGSAKPKGAPVPAANVVDWGGADEYARDNYFITEESAPAKLGSSLGWLLQLDGDNLRNAMLNAPWVKAVIPIRIGKEREAINWLRQAHVEGNDGLDATYDAAPTDPPELQSTADQTVTVLDALHILSERIAEFDRETRSPVMPNPADAEDPRNHFAGSLPTEAVFESGFYPLQGGVRFNQSGTSPTIFSQWLEILPTDQIAAVEVEYDPVTLQVRGIAQPPRAPVVPAPPDNPPDDPPVDPP